MWIGWTGGQRKQRRGKGGSPHSSWLLSVNALCVTQATFLVTRKERKKIEKEKQQFPSSPKGREESETHGGYPPNILSNSHLSVVDALSVC